MPSLRQPVDFSCIFAFCLLLIGHLTKDIRMTASSMNRPSTRRGRRLNRIACCLTGALLVVWSGPAQGQECAFVGNQLVGTVRVLTVPDGSEVDQKTLPDCNLGICQLTDIAVHPGSGEVFVSQLDGNRIWVVDPLSDDSPAQIALNGAPTDLVFRPDSTELFVISGATSEAAVLDPDTKAEIGRFDLPSEPRGLTVSPNGSALVTTSRNQNTVSILDSSDGSVVQSGVTGERPLAVALSPSGDRAFAAAEDGTLTVVDVASGETEDTITVGALPAAVAVHPNGETVYVANRGDDTVSVVTVESGAVTAVDVGRAPVALAVTSDGLVVVANLQGGSLSILDSANQHTEIGPIDAGVSPFALAVAACPNSTPTCTGDCNGDGTVGINELIVGVNINLGMRPAEDCRAFDENSDGEVAVSELIRAVRNSLDGCPS